MSLTPFGFVPVATFPHFATSRTFAAEAVIFSEIQNIQKFAGNTSNYSLLFSALAYIKYQVFRTIVAQLVH